MHRGHNLKHRPHHTGTNILLLHQASSRPFNDDLVKYVEHLYWDISWEVLVTFLSHVLPFSQVSCLFAYSYRLKASPSCIPKIPKVFQVLAAVFIDILVWWPQSHAVPMDFRYLAAETRVSCEFLNPLYQRRHWGDDHVLEKGLVRSNVCHYSIINGSVRYLESEPSDTAKAPAHVATRSGLLVTD